MKLLAIDIGASGGKAVTGEIRDNRLIVTEIRRFPNGIIDLNGHRHWDIFRLFEEVKECLRAAPDAASVGIDTWGVDYGYIGHDGDLMGLPFSYRDSRIEDSIQIVHERISKEELYGLTGIQFLPFNTIYQVADDLISRPWILENAHKLVMIPELIAFFLTGIAASEYTNASTTSMLDVTTRGWSDEISGRIGFPGDLFLEPIQNAGGVQTELNDQIIRETGCGAGFTYTACHDTACAVAAIPVDTSSGKNFAYISSGTWSLVGMELGKPIVTEAARRANFTNEGGVGGTIRFLSNVTGLWLLEELRRIWANDGKAVDFDEIITEAEKSPPFRSIVNPDHPSFAVPEDMRVAIREFCRSTGQTIPNGVGPFSRCVFESLALAYRRKIFQLREITGRKIDRIYVVGGGSRNRLLCRMTADACGIPVIAGPAEASAIGNLIVQAVGRELIGSISYGRRIIANSIPLDEFIPSETDLWEPVAERFEELVEKT